MIIARSYEEADRLADQLAERADFDCPDDAENSGYESYGSWFNAHINGTPSTAQLEGVPVYV